MLLPHLKTDHVYFHNTSLLDFFWLDLPGKSVASEPSIGNTSKETCPPAKKLTCRDTFLAVDMLWHRNSKTAKKIAKLANCQLWCALSYWCQAYGEAQAVLRKLLPHLFHHGLPRIRHRMASGRGGVMGGGCRSVRICSPHLADAIG